MALPVFQSFRVTVEIPLFLTAFAIMLQYAISTNLIIYRTCYTLLDYPKENCSHLGNEETDMTKWLEPRVQPTVNHINMVQSSIVAIVPLFVCMFVGLWSDKFGRKPFLVASLAGALFSIVATTLIVYFENMTPWWFIATMMPYVLTGHFETFMLLVITYIADVSTTEQRAIRLSAFDIIFAMSSFLGNVSASYIFYATNYVTVYVIGMSLTGLGLVYTIFLIPESLKEHTEAPKTGEVLKNVNLMDVLKDIFRKRPNNGRTHLLAILGIMLVQNFTIGEMSVSTLYLRAKMSWPLSKITLASGITNILNVIGTVFGTVVLHKLLKVKEFPLVLLSTISSIVANILQANATNDYYIYGSIIVTVFKGVGSVMLRTVLSLIISPQEMGKIFAVTTILTSLDQLIANLLYPLVYNATLNTNSGIFYYMSAGMTTIAGILIIYMMTVNYTHYEPPTKEEQLESELENKKSINSNSTDMFTTTQRMSLEIGARKFSIRSITNNAIS